MSELSDWTEWPPSTKMAILATHYWWHLFNKEGKPYVVRRFKKKVTEGGVIRHLCEEEVCNLYSEDESMTKEARRFMQVAWVEYKGLSR